MRVAVASGKGGTGKTTVAVALARAAPGPVDLIDCDVEEPNAHLFLTPDGVLGEAFEVLRPLVDSDRCTRCGRCVDFCAFGALALAGNEVLVFEDLCHACGGCAVVCPQRAIAEVRRRIGTLHQGRAGPVRLSYGQLDIGQTLAPPLIRAAQDLARPEALQIVDSPPGTTCPMVAAVSNSDFVLLVTENTPFGIHDLALAAEVVRALDIPHAVLINRSDIGPPDYGSAHEYCRREGIEVLLEIPFDPRVAETYAVGGSLLDAGEQYRPMFTVLLEQMAERAGARL